MIVIKMPLECSNIYYIHQSMKKFVFPSQGQINSNIRSIFGPQQTNTLSPNRSINPSNRHQSQNHNQSNSPFHNHQDNQRDKLEVNNYQDKNQSQLPATSQFESVEILKCIQLKHIYKFIKDHYLNQFLMTISSSQLNQASRKKASRQDQQFLNERKKDKKSQMQKTNILNLTVDEVFVRWHHSNPMFIKLSYDCENKRRYSRIADHPTYGIALIQRFPDKYYLGKNSQHYNHSKEIDEAYRLAGCFDQNSECYQKQNDEQNDQEEQGNQQSQYQQLQGFIQDDDCDSQSGQQQNQQQKNIQEQNYDQSNNSCLERYLIADEKENNQVQNNSQQLNQSTDIKGHETERSDGRIKRSNKMDIDSD